MTWTKLGDDHFERPVAQELSRDARLLEVEGLVYCNRLLTDGHVTRKALRLVTDLEDVGAVAGELVAAGLWTADDEGGYRIVDFGEHQPSAETVKARQAANRDRQSAFRERQARHARGDHSSCLPRYCRQVRNGVTDNMTNDASNALPVPVPDPYPSPTSREGMRDGDPAGAGSRSASPAGGDPWGTGAFGPPPGTVVRVNGREVDAG